MTDVQADGSGIAQFLLQEVQPLVKQYRAALVAREIDGEDGDGAQADQLLAEIEGYREEIESHNPEADFPSFDLDDATRLAAARDLLKGKANGFAIWQSRYNVWSRENVNKDESQALKEMERLQLEIDRTRAYIEELAGEKHEPQPVSPNGVEPVPAG